MNINNIFDVARHAMSAQMVRLNTVSSNIANAGSISTTQAEAYRPMRPVFEAVYSDNLRRPGLSTTRAKEVVSLARDAGGQPPIFEYHGNRFDLADAHGAHGQDGPGVRER